jgi:hypothetical protein
MKKAFQFTLLFSSLCCCALILCTNNANNQGAGGTVLVSGVILDAHNASPVSGVMVGVTENAASETTGTDGKFILDNIPAEETFLYFTKEHFMPQVLRIDLSGTSGMVAADTVFFFRDYAIMTGTLFKDDSLSPLAGATVRSIDSCDQCTNDGTVTDASGRFTLAYLVPDSLGRHFMVTAAGYQPLLFVRVLRPGDSVHATGYCRPYLSASGKIVESGSSTPVAGVTVACGSDTVTGDNAGIFSFARLIATDTGLVFRFFKTSFDTMTLKDTITASGSIGTVVLHRSTGTVQGTVTLQGRKTHAGTVVFLPAAGFRDTTDSAGHFRIPQVPAGSWQILMTNKDFSCPPCTAAVNANAATTIDLFPIVQSGFVECRVDWRPETNDSVKTYNITDTLLIMPGGSLNLYAGVRVQMEDNSRIIVSGQGAFTSMGDSGRFVDISPVPGLSAGNCSIEFPATKTYVPSMQFTKVTNTPIISQTGFGADHCLFISMSDVRTGPMIHLLSSPGPSTFANCDFIRIRSGRTPSVLQGSGMAQGPVFTDCIFYMANDGTAFPCNPFCESENPANGVTTAITNRDFFSTCAMADPLFAAIVPDTANIFTVDPGYSDIAGASFFLKSSSQLLDKSSAHEYLGALGKE